MVVIPLFTVNKNSLIAGGPDLKTGTTSLKNHRQAARSYIKAGIKKRYEGAIRKVAGPQGNVHLG